MKKALLLFSTLLAFLASEAQQKTKKFDIAETMVGSITGWIEYNSDGRPIDTSYYFSARDDRYKQLIEYIKLYDGSLNGLLSFLKYCKETLAKEDIDVYLNYSPNGNRLYISERSGFKIISIYGIGDNTSGCCSFNSTMLERLIKKTESWANKNRVKID